MRVCACACLSSHVPPLRASHPNSASACLPACRGIRVIALDLSCFNLKLGREGMRLGRLQQLFRFGPAGPAAAAAPLDLRLRYLEALRARVAARRAELQHKQDAEAELEREVVALQARLDVAAAAVAAAQANAACLPDLTQQLAAVEDELERVGMGTGGGGGGTRGAGTSDAAAAAKAAAAAAAGRGRDGGGGGGGRRAR